MDRIHRFLGCTTLMVLFLVISGTSSGQVETGKLPKSFNNNMLSGTLIPEVLVESPDLKSLEAEDHESSLREKPYRVGIVIPFSIDLFEKGRRDDLPDGGSIRRISVRSFGAVALGIDFERFDLPEGAELYVYSADQTYVIGGFTRESVSGNSSFAIRPVRGDELIIEYYVPDYAAPKGEVLISGLNFIYRGWDIHPENEVKNFGGSGSCEVNTNCSEGALWKSQSDGVVRILSRVKNQSFWCTGVVVNNTNLDFSPFILTANHCSESGSLTSTSSDLEKWTFYFNYESSGCDDPVYEPVEHSMVGAEKVASSKQPVEIGSDFFLLRLKQLIPSSYNAYYNGWSTENQSSANGVSIHHPQGDIKKISTYNTSLQSGNWQSIPNTHWIVQWSPTPNGHGVTEPGSSGSPIFDQNGLVIGTLTGGESGCANTDGKDYYGKLAYSWGSNGTADSMQLRPWLDPIGSGNNSLQGTYNTKIPLADFKADTTTVVVGGTLNFFDLSSHDPYSWEWQFDGGEPSVSTERNPSGIRFDSCGQYSVHLKVANQYGTDSVVKVTYIKVKARIYPNPTRGHVTIFTNSTNSSRTVINVYAATGSLVQKHSWVGDVGKSIELDMPKAGKLFYLEMIQDDYVQVFPVIVFTPNLK